MYEAEILQELRNMNERLARLEALFLDEKKFGGMRFSDGVTRIIYGVE